MDGTQIVIGALSEMAFWFCALVAGLVTMIGGFYLVRAMWIILGRRK